MIVLVTGAAGQLGRTVAENLTAAGHAVAALTKEDLDTLDVVGCRRIVRAIGPHVIVDCAVVRGHPDGVFQIPKGAYNLAATARAVDAFSIFISCADVFRGDVRRAYLESDTPGPVDEFGAAKLSAERAVVKANEHSAVIRTSWLFGPGGNNLVEATLNDASVSDIVVADSGTRSCPTYAGHLAAALRVLVGNPARGVFHVAGEGSCTKFEFARAVVRAAELDAHVAPLSAGPSILPERHLVLGSERAALPILPDWRVGLHDYLAARGGYPALSGSDGPPRGRRG